MPMYEYACPKCHAISEGYNLYYDRESYPPVCKTCKVRTSYAGLSAPNIGAPFVPGMMTDKGFVKGLLRKDAPLRRRRKVTVS